MASIDPSLMESATAMTPASSPLTATIMAVLASACKRTTACLQTIHGDTHGLHHAQIAHEHLMAGNVGVDALTGNSLEGIRSGPIRSHARSLPLRLPPPADARCPFQRKPPGAARSRFMQATVIEHDVCHRGPAPGDGAGLVQHDRAHRTCPLQRFARLEQDAHVLRPCPCPP